MFWASPPKQTEVDVHLHGIGRIGDWKPDVGLSVRLQRVGGHEKESVDVLIVLKGGDIASVLTVAFDFLLSRVRIDGEHFHPKGDFSYRINIRDGRVPSLLTIADGGAEWGVDATFTLIGADGRLHHVEKSLRVSPGAAGDGA